MWSKTYKAFALALALAATCSQPVLAQKKTDKQHKARKPKPAAQLQPARFVPQAVDQRVSQLMEKMSLEEKVGQMMQLTIDVLLKQGTTEIDAAVLEKAVRQYKIGSVLNTGGNMAMDRTHWHKLISQIQQLSIKETGIPVLYGVDAIHGVTYTTGATFFPQQIGQGATWNPALVEKGAEITAYEMRASSIPWDFSPVLDLGLDPRWPRQWETYGEDPHLVSVMGKAAIRGYQGADMSNPNRGAACLKHFLGYSLPLSGKDRTPAWLPERQLREYFLPGFRQAIDAGALTVMVNSGEINGIPVHINRDILTGLLKQEMGFEGFAVTDWQDIEYLHTRHRVAPTQKEAVKMAVNAGIDMSMIPYNFEFADHLLALVREGQVPMERIDDAVRRILRVKVLLGLMERPVTDPKDYPDFGSEAFAAAARKTAEESITLLKNEQGALPLPASAKVLVTGPNAHSMRTLNGGWSYSWQGERAGAFTAQYKTILQAVEALAGKQQVSFVQGVKYPETEFFNAYKEDQAVDIQAAVEAAKGVDYILLCLGENSYTEKPGDLETLDISANQVALAKALAQTGKPIVLVLNEGRPRIISSIEPLCKAVVQTYLPGNYGGEALASVLYGKVNPSGKLPYTYPRYANSLVPYFHKYTESLDSGSEQYKSFFNPQYAFGHGLSYTTFAYEGLKLSASKISAQEPVEVSVTVRNTGKVAGKEVVHLFVSDLYASVTPEVKRLRAFQKVELAPGESKSITFTLTAKDLSFVGMDLKQVAEAGAFQVQVGGQTATFELTENKTFEQKDETRIM